MTATSATATPASASAAPRALSGRRRAVVWVLVVGATLLGFVSVMSLWINRQMLDNNAWQRASAQVIADPQIRSAIASYTVNELYDNVDVAALLAAKLPPNLQPLAGPVAGALRQPATQGFDALLARPRFQKLWIGANAVAHEKLVNVLEQKSGAGVSSGNGTVTLNLGAIVQQLGATLGLPARGLSKLPPNAGVITVMRSSQLAAAQKGVRAIRILSVWLLVLVLCLYALAVYLARGGRRVVLRNIGFAFVITGVVVLILRRTLGNYVVDGLTSPPYRGSIHNIWLIGTSELGQIGGATILYGSVLAAGAALAGPTRAGVALRRSLAPTLNRSPGIAASAVAFAYLLLVLWGPTHALRAWWGILLFAGLLAEGVFALRQQTLREYPDEAALDDSVSQEIERLRALRDTGTITQDEFARRRELALH